MSQNLENQKPVRNDNFTEPVSGGEVPKVDDAIAVGEDLHFQERWWKFERITWTFFTLVLLADIVGIFGEGPLARAKITDANLGMQVNYERVERTGTPNMLRVQFGPDAVQDGKVQIYVSNSVVKDLGAQRVIPQPEKTTLTEGGMTYTFPASANPSAVEFELAPTSPGLKGFRLQVPGKAAVSRRVLVMP
jgi:hypothetical protein